MLVQQRGSSGQFVDPVRSWQVDRSLRHHVLDQCVEVDAAANSQCRINLTENGKVVAMRQSFFYAKM